ncbi:MAG: ATP synthase F1 subunit delta [Dehalococcoidia bacterium]
MARGASPKRYAQAVFQMAAEPGEQDRWHSDLRLIAQALTDPQFQKILASPKIRFEQKASMLAKVLEGVGPLALNLASLLTAQGHMGIAGGIAEEYGRLLDDQRGIEHALVTTAIPLDDKGRDNVARKLGELRGKKVIVETREDAAIIGGLVARIGDQLLDGSTRGKLQAMRKNLVGSSR